MQNAAAALSMIVEAFLDDESSQLLTRSTELYDSLKVAHATDSFKHIQICPELRRQAYSGNLPKYLNGNKPFFIALAHDTNTPIPTPDPWSPDITDPLMLAHVESLAIFHTGGKPHLILNDLGTMDPVFESRVENIFQRGKHALIFRLSSLTSRLSYDSLLLGWEKPGLLSKACAATGFFTLPLFEIPAN
ncbi:hypothetical protein B0H11DRAFT_1231455 [Mycena galericulata]|nr:hypothetical protein B0H11DRAFT_1231455 [Mycena galericulata]